MTGEYTTGVSWCWKNKTGSGNHSPCKPKRESLRNLVLSTNFTTGRGGKWKGIRNARVWVTINPMRTSVQASVMYNECWSMALRRMLVLCLVSGAAYPSHCKSRRLSPRHRSGQLVNMYCYIFTFPLLSCWRPDRSPCGRSCAVSCLRDAVFLVKSCPGSIPEPHACTDAICREHAGLSVGKRLQSTKSARPSTPI